MKLSVVVWENTSDVTGWIQENSQNDEKSRKSELYTVYQKWSEFHHVKVFTRLPHTYSVQYCANVLGAYKEML